MNPENTLIYTHIISASHKDNDKAVDNNTNDYKRLKVLIVNMRWRDVTGIFRRCLLHQQVMNHVIAYK